METSVIYDMPSEEYAAVDAVSNSRLSRFRECPAAATIERKQTPSMLFGIAAHDIILCKGERVLVMPKIDRRTVAGKEAFADYTRMAEGKLVITEDEAAQITAIKKSIMEHPTAVKILEDSEREVSLFWTDKKTGLPCKARLDILGEGHVIADLKIAADVSPKALYWEVIKQHGFQAAWFSEGYRQVFSALPIFKWIAAQKEPLGEGGTHRCEVYRSEWGFLHGDRPGSTDYFELNSEALGRYRAALDNKDFPHYSSLEHLINNERSY